MGAIAVILFLAAGVAFILGLKLLARPETARKGNAVSALGMLSAIAGTLVQIVSTHGDAFTLDRLVWIAVGLGVGVLVGVGVMALGHSSETVRTAVGTSISPIESLVSRKLVSFAAKVYVTTSEARIS